MARALRERRWDAAIAAANGAPAGAARSRLLAHALIARRADGDLDRARNALVDWAARAPTDPEPWRRSIEFALHQEDLEAADEALSRLEARSPAGGDPAFYHGLILQRKGRLEEALAAYRESIAERRRAQGLPPLEARALDLAAGMQLCETAAGNYPGSPGPEPEGLFDQQRAAELLRDRLEAFQPLSDGSSADDAAGGGVAEMIADGWYNLGCAAMAGFGGHDQAVNCFERSVKFRPEGILARLNAVFALNYCETITPEALYEAHRRAGQWLRDRSGPATAEFPNTREPERRLRVGYLSSDFRQHSVAHFILPVLAVHDPDRFEIILYHTHPRQDAFTAMAREAAASFRHVADWPDERLMQQIAADRIDILIDLNGLTERHRMALLARRAAPLQMTWIGYPNTTGLDSVDYRIVDPRTDPPGRADALATERLLRLPDVFSVYRPPGAAPDPGPLPAAQRGYVTFGSFNALPKLNVPLLRNWAELLHRVPRSRLLIKNVGLGYEEPRRSIAAVLADQGIGPERLTLAGHTADQKSHLEWYNEVDIALDSFPYHGTTTTCESLYMGVPVVSRAGLDHRSRVAVSQLRAVGLESLVASDENSLSEIAAELASDVGHLAEMRAGLRARLLSSPLTDAPALTRQLESALRGAWARWCRQEDER